MKLYSVKDKLVDEFGPPFSAKNDAVALRMCKEMSKNMPASDDYQLFCIGDFSESVGKIRITDDEKGLYPIFISDELYIKKEDK